MGLVRPLSFSFFQKMNLTCTTFRYTFENFFSHVECYAHHIWSYEKFFEYSKNSWKISLKILKFFRRANLKVYYMRKIECLSTSLRVKFLAFFGRNCERTLKVKIYSLAFNVLVIFSQKVENYTYLLEIFINVNFWGQE